LFASSESTEESQNYSAKVLFIKGVVQVKESSESEWKDATRGSVLNEGAEISVGPNGACELAVGNEIDSAIQIRANSYFVLRQMKPGRFVLPKGEIFAVVNHLPVGISRRQISKC